MTEVRRRTEMPVSAQALFDWHERPGAFDRLTPAWMPVEVRHREGGIRDGARVTIALPMGPVSIPWTLGHTGYTAGEGFRDIQIRGPFRSWEHVHRMEPVSAHASVLDDRITFALPLPPLGGWVAGWYTRAELARLLQWRHALTRNDLERRAHHPTGAGDRDRAGPVGWWARRSSPSSRPEATGSAPSGVGRRARCAEIPRAGSSTPRRSMGSMRWCISPGRTSGRGGPRRGGARSSSRASEARD